MSTKPTTVANRIPKSAVRLADHVVQIEVQLVSQSICGEQVVVYKRMRGDNIVLVIELPIDEQVTQQTAEQRKFLVEKAYREVLLVHPHLIDKLNTVGDQTKKER